MGVPCLPDSICDEGCRSPVAIIPSNGVLGKARLNEEMTERAASRTEKDTHTFTLWNSDVSDEEKGPTLQSNLRKVTGKKSFHRASFDVTVQFTLELLH